MRAEQVTVIVDAYINTLKASDQYHVLYMVNNINDGLYDPEAEF